MAAGIGRYHISLCPKHAQVDALVEALRPFAHPDLAQLVGGNVQGDYSPVLGRNTAVLTIGDFRRAQEALAAVRSGKEKQ
jgi:hypothetical protein